MRQPGNHSLNRTMLGRRSTFHWCRRLNPADIRKLSCNPVWDSTSHQRRSTISENRTPHCYDSQDTDNSIRLVRSTRQQRSHSLNGTSTGRSTCTDNSCDNIRSPLNNTSRLGRSTGKHSNRNPRRNTGTALSAPRTLHKAKPEQQKAISFSTSFFLQAEITAFNKVYHSEIRMSIYND
jgi:hypothetical protein